MQKKVKYKKIQAMKSSKGMFDSHPENIGMRVQEVCDYPFPERLSFGLVRTQLDAFDGDALIRKIADKQRTQNRDNSEHHVGIR